MTENEIKEIWERGDEEEIKKLAECLPEKNNSFRVIHRREKMMKYYFKNHKKEDGYFFNPKQYVFVEGDGEKVTYILEGIK